MRLLMCPPPFFTVTYEINAWMQIENIPDPARALSQWNALTRILTEDIGAEVSLITPQAALPDMVFTANAGITKGKTFVPSRFRFAQRQGEVPHFIAWFEENGFEICALPHTISGTFEGEGDALFYGETLLAGFGPRSDAGVYAAVGNLLGCDIIPLGLTDARWYHLDTCLIPLRPDLLAYYPPAFDAEANSVLSSLPGEKIFLTERDALRFGGNAIVIDNHVVMNTGCDTLAETLTAHGFHVHATDTSEFLKAGGSAKCLALVLDH